MHRCRNFDNKRGDGVARHNDDNDDNDDDVLYASI